MFTIERNLYIFYLTSPFQNYHKNEDTVKKITILINYVTIPFYGCTSNNNRSTVYPLHIHYKKTFFTTDKYHKKWGNLICPKIAQKLRYYKKLFFHQKLEVIAVILVYFNRKLDAINPFKSPSKNTFFTEDQKRKKIGSLYPSKNTLKMKIS